MKKKKLIIIPLLLIMMTGCIKKEEVVVPVTITKEDTEKMEVISKHIFTIGKDKLKYENLTNDEKEEIARSFVENGILSVTGTEMEKTFQKYFGEDQKIEFHDIPCFMTHNNEQEQILYVFNKETDKYEFNENHPGHGGGGNVKNKFMINNISVTVDENKVYYDAKVLFYGPSWCYDTGGCEYGKLYKSYSDLKNEKNALLDIGNSKYTKEVEGPPETDLEAIEKDFKSEGTTYRFNFIKEEDNLKFIDYQMIKQ